MKNLFLISVILVSSLSVQAQYAQISDRLESEIKKSSDPIETFQVFAILVDQVDIESLVERLDKNLTPNVERKKITTNLLWQKAESSQKGLVAKFASLQSKFPNDIYSFQAFWIHNMFGIEATAKGILELQKFSELSLIDLDITRDFVTPKTVRGEISIEPEGPNGTEQGQRAINAPFMWDKGYTGRGALGMIIDDGTYALHPALRKNFKGYYAPLSESYFGGNFPGCISDDSHGIHTAGTMLGRDPLTKDTIGTAFQAYWIGASGLGGCSQGSSTFIQQFQWALNPDGNLATTDDIPDVINCSWGSAAGGMGTAQCTGAFVGILNTLETAGVAVVFSAGNDGPNAQTITDPKNINTSLVNTFTVGNLDAFSSTLPINFSSSRGPSVCGKTGSLLIKPEVSAPGTNVRSAIGKDTYSANTGTSMAAPHVSGALLLLREAFPTASATELKLALYRSARDLGAAGEDNIYGMGIIDLKAAFDTLSKAFTPTTPINPLYDLAIREITKPIALSCGNNVEGEVVLVNYGSRPIINATIEYWIDSRAHSNHNWTGVLTAGSTVTIKIPSGTFIPTPGTHMYHVRVTPGGGVSDVDQLNNSSIKEFTISPSISVPYLQNFEVLNFGLTNFVAEDPDFQYGWNFKIFNGAASGLRAMSVDKFRDIYKGSKDYLYLPEITVPTNRLITLNYKWAYRMRLISSTEILTVSISNDCGNSWQDIKQRQGATLATVPGFINKEFIPTGLVDYNTDTVDLSQYISSNKILLRFQVEAGRGNLLYLDDIELSNSGNVGIEKINPGSLSIAPNPNKGSFALNYENLKLGITKYILRNSIGEIVSKKSFNSNAAGSLELNFDWLACGVYTFQLIQDEKQLVKKIIIE